MPADANRVLVSYVEEAAFGVTPGGPPTLQDVRYTSESLGQDTDTVSSQEIRSDRQVPDVVRTNVGASGDVAVELSYGVYDNWLYRALMADADFDAEVVIAAADTAVSADTSDDSFNHATAWDATPTAGQWIEVRGFVNADNNGFFKIVSATSTKIVVEGNLTTEAAGPSVNIDRGGEVKNGTTFKSYSIEKHYQDLTTTFEVLRGMAINSLALNVTPDAILTGTFGFLGKDSISGSATVGDGSNTSAPTNDVMNAIDHVKYIAEAGAVYGSTGFDFTLNNNLRSRQQIGTLGAVSLGTGTIDITGTVQAYFDNSTVMDKYLNFTDTSLGIVVEDGAGNAYVFDFPRVKYTSGRRVAGGINTDIIADMAFTAYREPTENVTLRVVRFPA